VRVVLTLQVRTGLFLRAPLTIRGSKGLKGLQWLQASRAISIAIHEHERRRGERVDAIGTS
jgi:hypothetical protein